MNRYSLTVVERTAKFYLIDVDEPFGSEEVKSPLELMALVEKTAPDTEIVLDSDLFSIRVTGNKPTEENVDEPDPGIDESAEPTGDASGGNPE